MSDNKKRLGYLLKTDGANKDCKQLSIENSKKYKNTKKQMRGFLQSI